MTVNFNMESWVGCKISLKWLGLHALLFQSGVLEFLWLMISCRSTIFPNMDTTPKKLLITQIRGCSLKKFTAYTMKKDVLGSFFLLHRVFMAMYIKNLLFIFDFWATLLIVKIVQSRFVTLKTFALSSSLWF